MILKFEPNITIDYILSKVSEEEIISYYMQEPIEFGSFYLSPIRDKPEKNPSFSFKQGHRSIKWMDWGIGKSGNCFDLVQEIYKISFKDALFKIYEDLINNKYIYTKNTTKALKSKEKEQIKPIIELEPFTVFDIEYWKQFNISLQILADYNISRVKRCTFIGKDNEKKTIWSRLDSPIYRYYFNQDSYKLYAPFNDKKYKFIFRGDKSVIQGYDQLDRTGDLLVITKSLKDVMCLRSFGINAISFQGEGYKLESDLYNNIKKRFNRIISLYDYDNTGITGAELLEQQYDISSYFIPIEYNTKDISEYCEKFGYENTTNFVTKLLNNDYRENRNTLIYSRD